MCTTFNQPVFDRDVTFPLEASLSQAPNDELTERWWGLRRQTGTVASSSNPAPLHGWHGGVKATTHLEFFSSARNLRAACS